MKKLSAELETKALLLDITLRLLTDKGAFNHGRWDWIENFTPYNESLEYHDTPEEALKNYLRYKEGEAECL